MKAIIQKIELKNIFNRYYIRMELLDENGVKRSIKNPFLSDEMNFRRQVFGILSACDNYDLMRLATNNPIPKKMIGYYWHKLQILENENGECLYFNRETGLYCCKKMSTDTRKGIEMLMDENILDGFKKEGVIQNIVSRSGTFMLLFLSKSGGTHFVTGQIYYGFGYPFRTLPDASPSNVAYAAKLFTSFIVSLMKLYGIHDLLKFGGNIDQLPIVEIELKDNNKIDSITNPSTGMGFSIGKEYEMVNIFEKGEKRILRLRKGNKK